ncbi:MAG TPA: hypothetical protein VN688_28795 [Gemmataceae bacterium]|nr:hypothetical protein [Gemmataceae bacterium]
MLDLITQVRNLALEAEQKGQKLLAAKLRAVADEIEAPVSADWPTCGPASESKLRESSPCRG